MNKLIQNGWMVGDVLHSRKHPKQHEFKYKDILYCCSIDPNIHKVKCGITCSINFHNHGPYREESESLYTRLLKYLQKNYANLDLSRKNIYIQFLVRPAQLFYQFNPICFFLVYYKGHLHFILNEVSNTPWKESTIYPMYIDSTIDSLANNITVEKEFKKKMHVSPFNSIRQIYKIKINIQNNKFLCLVNVKNLENENIMHASINVKSTVIKKIDALQQFGFTFKLISRIYINALFLYLKNNPIYKKGN